MVGQGLIAGGAGVLLGVGRVDAVHAGALQQGVAAHLRGPQRGRVGRKEGRADAGGEDHHPAFFEMTQGAAAHIGLGHGVHGQGALHARLDADLLQRRLHGQGVHHRGQHAHIVGGGAFHVAGGLAQSAEDVAAADDEADLDALARHVSHGLGHAGDRLHVDAV